MFCPSCGAPNTERDQRYCRECGATLPAAPATSSAISTQPAPGTPLNAQGSSSRSSALLKAGAQNKVVTGAVVLVVAVVAAYLVIQMIIHVITALLFPLVIVLALCALGYFYLKSLRRR
jgi:hypothetical protein